MVCSQRVQWLFLSQVTRFFFDCEFSCQVLCGLLIWYLNWYLIFEKFQFTNNFFNNFRKSPACIHLLKVSNGNTRTIYEICLKLILRSPEGRHWRRFGVFIVNFEHILLIGLAFLLLTLKCQLGQWLSYKTLSA